MGVFFLQISLQHRSWISGSVSCVAGREYSSPFLSSILHFRISLEYSKIVTYSGLTTYRYVPQPSVLGSSEQEQNNSCYCMEGFSCLKSGVFNMEPCKVSPDTPRGSPIALSWPHFYQADPSYLAAVTGLSPSKEKHEFFFDIEPQLGIPLAVRPRLQINAIMRRDQDIQQMRSPI